MACVFQDELHSSRPGRSSGLSGPNRVDLRWTASCLTLYMELDMNVLNCACATPPGTDQVRATNSLDDVAGCTLMGKVVVSDSGDAAKAARAETARLGGNVLLKKSDQVWNGNAYHCAAAH